jgi:hypothetical protein
MSGADAKSDVLGIFGVVQMAAPQSPLAACRLHLAAECPHWLFVPTMARCPLYFAPRGP